MKYSSQNVVMLISLLFKMIFSHASATKSGAPSLALMSAMTENRKSHIRDLRMESDSEDSTFPYQNEKKVALRPRSNSPFQDKYPAPHAKDSKWRFDLHFSVLDCDMSRGSYFKKWSRRSSKFRKIRDLDAIRYTLLSTIRTKVALLREMKLWIKWRLVCEGRCTRKLIG